MTIDELIEQLEKVKSQRGVEGGFKVNILTEDLEEYVPLKVYDFNPNDVDRIYIKAY